MDGLPIKEETGLTYASANENMHACGHDAHTAMLIATAVMLKNHEDELKGKVKLIFQPAEEGPGGAEPMVKDGVIDDVDAILALHVGTMFRPFNNGGHLCELFQHYGGRRSGADQYYRFWRTRLRSS